ncbi:MAG: Hsp33 family molecular chaperone HslO [Neisseriaceae bacterium]|nr:MAG: Hsp33 family molecular chaperone HslO [Neisseriaceae bacterium]
MSSFLQKFIFDKLPVKGSFVNLTDVWQKISQQQAYPTSMNQLVGELLVANILLTSNLKLDGKVICQIQNSEFFRLVVSECSSKLETRATAKFDAVSMASTDYTTLLSSGSLVVSIDSHGDGQLYQSIIAFNGNHIDEILNNYMTQSEQLRSLFIIAFSENQVSGFMLQQLPDVHSMHTDEIDRIFMLAETLTKSELLHNDSETILYKLFHEDDVRILDAHNICFKCTCNKLRISEILCNLGKQELEDMIREQGDISVNCEYCNSKYDFSKSNLEELVLQISLDEMKPVSHQIN